MATAAILTSADINSMCSVNGDGNYLGYAGLDTMSYTTPTRYYNQDDCESLKGTFTKIPDSYNGQNSVALNSSNKGETIHSTIVYNWSNRYNVGTCVRPNAKNGQTVSLSETCASLPTNLALNMRYGNLIPAQGRIFGTPQCDALGSKFIMDANGNLRCTTGNPITAPNTNTNIMLV
jgi:hypothetical protein